MTIRMLIADDHDLIREGLRYAVQNTEIEIVGEAASGEAAIQLALESTCDLLLLDVRMPRVNGFDVIERLKAERPEIPILIYSHHDRADFRDRANLLSASGYIAKSADKNELINAIRRVAQGEQLWTEPVS